MAGMCVNYVKTALASYDGFVGAIAADDGAVGDFVYMDAVGLDLTSALCRN